MDKHNSEEKYNISLLRGWQRDQLKFLRLFVDNKFVSQTLLSGASGIKGKPNVLGGKITALTRADLIQKAGKDENGQFVWQLNENRVGRTTLGEVLDSIGIEKSEPVNINNLGASRPASR